MHVFAFVWSGLKHCRRGEDKSNPAAQYQPRAHKEVELCFNESTGSTTLHVTNSNNTNTNQPTMINTTIENSNLRASKLIELCQAKIDSLNDQD